MAIDLEVLGRGVGRASEIFGGALHQEAQRKKEQKQWEERLKTQLEREREFNLLSEQDKAELKRKEDAYRAEVDFYAGSPQFTDWTKRAMASDNLILKISGMASVGLMQKLHSRERLTDKDYEAIKMFPPEVSLPMGRFAGQLKQELAEYDVKVKLATGQEKLLTAQAKRAEAEAEEIVGGKKLQAKDLLVLIRQKEAMIDKVVGEPLYADIRGKVLMGQKRSKEEERIYAAYYERLAPLMNSLAQVERQLQEQYPDYIYEEIKEPEEEKEEEPEEREKKPFELPEDSPLKQLEDIFTAKSPLEAMEKIFGKRKPKSKEEEEEEKEKKRKIAERAEGALGKIIPK